MSEDAIPIAQLRYEVKIFLRIVGKINFGDVAPGAVARGPIKARSSGVSGAVVHGFRAMCLPRQHVWRAISWYGQA